MGYLARRHMVCRWMRMHFYWMRRAGCCCLLAGWETDDQPADGGGAEQGIAGVGGADGLYGFGWDPQERKIYLEEEGDFFVYGEEG